MRKRIWIVLSLALLTAAAWTVLGQPASGATTDYANLPVPAFAGREYSVHNKQGGAENACADFVPLQNGGENLGDLDNGKGSYFAFLRLPQGAKVTAFTLFVNDADADDDVHVYLVRKKVDADLSPATSGYRVMARASSSGAVINTMRRFSDDTVLAATVNNALFGYYVELVDCGIPEPFTVQVAFST